MLLLQIVKIASFQLVKNLSDYRIIEKHLKKGLVARVAAAGPGAGRAEVELTTAQGHLLALGGTVTELFQNISHQNISLQYVQNLNLLSTV